MSGAERMREFGAGLRRRRHAAGLDQATLAERMRGLGFPWYGSTVSKTEHGDRSPSLTELHGLAKVLDTDLLLLLHPTLDGEQTRAALAAAQATAARVAELEEKLAAARAEQDQHLGDVERLRRVHEATLDLLDHDLAVAAVPSAHAVPEARPRVGRSR